MKGRKEFPGKFFVWEIRRGEDFSDPTTILVNIYASGVNSQTEEKTAPSWRRVWILLVPWPEVAGWVSLNIIRG